MAAARLQSGFSLLEVVVTMGVVALLSAGAYTIFKPADSLAQVQVQGQGLEQLKASVNQTYMGRSSFDGISPTTVRLPHGLQTAGSWGAVSLEAVTYVAPNDSWAASFPTVPAVACQKVVLNQINNWDKITVNQVPVADVQAAIKQCVNSANVVAFTNYGPLHTSHSASDFHLSPPGPPSIIPPVVGTPMPIVPSPGTPPPSPSTPIGGPNPSGPVVTPGGPPAPPSGPAPAPAPPSGPAPAPIYPTCSVPSPVTRSPACPSGQVGSMTQTQTASCPTSYGPVVWGPWTTTANTCAPACTLPSPSTQTQTINCPAGQASSVAPYGTNGITQTRSATCPAQSGPYTWGDWSTTANTCAPTCVAPATVVTPGSQTASCPGGQVTISGGSTTFSQTNSKTTTYSCDAPTGPYTAHAGSPTAWTPAASSVCAAKCVVPPPNYGSGPCSDWNGLYTDGRNYAGSGYTLESDGSCPSPTGPVTWGASYLTVFNCSISNPCTLPNPSTNRQPSYYAAASCPAGQSLPAGSQSATWRTYTISTASCPKPYGPYTWSPATWDGTGGTYYSGCAPSCVAPGTTNTTETQVIHGSTPCYQGATTYDQNQVRTRTNTYKCTAPTGPYTTNPATYTAWANSGGQYNVNSNNCANCVAIDAYVYCRHDGVEQDMRAGDVRAHDELLLINPETGEKRWGRVSYSSMEKTEMVSIRTANGVTLQCSKSAPIGLFDGTYVLASEVMGRAIAVDVDGVYGCDTVVEVKELGEGEVQHITCENDFFLAGDEIGRYMAHHNKKIGFCVSVDAYVWARHEGVEQEMRAGNVRVGDELQSVDPHTGAKTWALVTQSNMTESLAVTFTTENGVSLTCSVTAPIALATGEAVLSVDLEGREIQVEDQGVARDDRVVSVKETDFINVQRIICGEVFFQAGDQSGRYVLHHD